jgi:hypothetical protein
MGEVERRARRFYRNNGKELVAKINGNEFRFHGVQFQFHELMEWKGGEDVSWLYVTACEYVGGRGRRLSSGWLGWFGLDGLVGSVPLIFFSFSTSLFFFVIWFKLSI